MIWICFRGLILYIQSTRLTKNNPYFHAHIIAHATRRRPPDTLSWCGRPSSLQFCSSRPSGPTGQSLQVWTATLWPGRSPARPVHRAAFPHSAQTGDRGTTWDTKALRVHDAVKDSHAWELNGLFEVMVHCWDLQKDIFCVVQTCLTLTFLHTATKTKTQTKHLLCHLLTVCELSTVRPASAVGTYQCI